jgi:hypothetical protein
MLRHCLLLFLLGSAGLLSSQALDGVIGNGEYDSAASFDDGGFTVSWRTEGDTAFFAVSAATSGWLALGLEPVNAMEAADMIVGWVTGGKEATVLDCYATGPFGPHPPDITLGGSSDLLDAAGNETNGRTVLEFTRLLSTGDRFDKDIPAGGSLHVIWAYGEEDLPDTAHTARGFGTLAFGATGQSATGQSATGQAAVGDPGWLLAAHALLLGLSFVCLSGAMLISRYFKKRRWWLKTHRLLGAGGAVLGAGGVAAMTVMLSLLSASHLRILHAYLGLLTLAGMLAAPLLGLRILRSRGSRPVLRGLHRWLGRSVILAMAVTIVLGLIRVGLL